MTTPKCFEKIEHLPPPQPSPSHLPLLRLPWFRNNSALLLTRINRDLISLSLDSFNSRTKLTCAILVAPVATTACRRKRQYWGIPLYYAFGQSEMYQFDSFNPSQVLGWVSRREFSLVSLYRIFVFIFYFFIHLGFNRPSCQSIATRFRTPIPLNHPSTMLLTVFSHLWKELTELQSRQCSTLPILSSMLLCRPSFLALSPTSWLHLSQSPGKR